MIFDDDYLNEYIESGGTYQSYAEHLLNPNDDWLYNVVCVPVKLDINRYALKQGYIECYQNSDWDYLMKKMRKSEPEIKMATIKNNYLIDSTAASELKTLNSLFGYSVGTHRMDYEFEKLHPSIMEYACQNKIGKLYLVSYVEESNLAFTQVMMVDINKGTIKQALYRKVPKASDSELYIPKRIWKTANGLQKNAGLKYEVY